jgi:hypothetical protein
MYCFRGDDWCCLLHICTALYSVATMYYVREAADDVKLDLK